MVADSRGDPGLPFRCSITQGGNKSLEKLIVKHSFFFFSFCKVEIVMGGYGQVCASLAEEYVRGN